MRRQVGLGCETSDSLESVAASFEKTRTIRLKKYFVILVISVRFLSIGSLKF
jgi:hypothetical protein